MCVFPYSFYLIPSLKLTSLSGFLNFLAYVKESPIFANTTFPCSVYLSGECKICLDDYLRIQQNALKMSFYSSDIQKELIKALEEFDEQGDGTMRKEELKAILVDYDDKNLDKVIAHADLNKDGRLSIKGSVFLFYM